MQTEAAGAPLALTWSWFSEKAHGTGYGGGVVRARAACCYDDSAEESKNWSAVHAGQPDVATEAPLQNAVEGQL